MGEYAYDFTGENAHYGPSRNPHAPAHMSGGSSGGSGTAAAAGLVHLTLGSDTNGSIRVPSSFCGLFGLKPTYGRLSRAGSFPFVSSFGHLGPMGRSALDLALAYDAMQGEDARDPMQAKRPTQATMASLGEGLSPSRQGPAGCAHSRRTRRGGFQFERLARTLRRRKAPGRYCHADSSRIEKGIRVRRDAGACGTFRARGYILDSRGFR